MMRVTVIVFLLLQFLFCIPSQAQSQTQTQTQIQTQAQPEARQAARQSVTVCFDPFSSNKVSGKPKPVEVEFFNKLIVNVFGRIGIKVKFITEFPFRRCLFEVESQRIDFVMGAYFDSERAKIFDYSNHYNTLTPQIFYLASKPVTITQLSDLMRYRGCGIYGSSYAHYGLKSESLDLGPGYESMIKKLRAGRCDYFVEELEVLRELRLSGQDYLSDESILHAEVPGAVSPSRYLVTAKNGRASPFLGPFNQALDEVLALPETREAWKKEFGNIVYKP